MHQFFIQILSHCTSNRLQVTKSYPTKRYGGPWPQGPRRRHLLECTVCERRGPCWPSRHPSASPARILTAARMTSSVRVPRPFVFMKAHIVGELRGDPRLHKCVLRLLLRVCGSYIPQYCGFELALSRAPVECAHTSKKLSLSDRRPMIDDQ